MIDFFLININTCKELPNSMCSIIACIDKDKDVTPLLVNALSLLEYRGYDSVGIAVLNGSSINVRKGVGNVREVSKKHGFDELKGKIGIGHTRWATHGYVNDVNAHPHTSCNGKVAIVHNGIIDNYLELRGMLKDHEFKSDTDSEVIAHLLEHFIGQGFSIKDAMVNVIRLINGSYAFVALLDDGTLLGSRNDEPLIIGVGDNKNGNIRARTYSTQSFFISSDVLAFIKHTDKAIFLSNKEFFIIKPTRKGYTLSIYNEYGNMIKKDITQIAWEFADIDKGKYAHYTLKEIHEQEYTVARALSADISNEFLRLLINARRVIVAGSGSSYHASLYAKYMLAKAGINTVDACIASELKYNDNNI
jgi:glutamine---fructose-6-phosphate transaminase (isomerizing)